MDTACSSSLYALHAATRALSSGEVGAAVVGGVNLILGIEHHMDTAKVGVLSPTSTCHTFDASADGYGRGDGIAALYLKPFSKAFEDGDPIRGVIRGTAVNSYDDQAGFLMKVSNLQHRNGKGIGINAPRRESQAAVMRKAYADAGISDYTATAFVECHGTGTAIGDPVEVEAVADVFTRGQDRKHPLLIGSVSGISPAGYIIVKTYAHCVNGARSRRILGTLRRHQA
jgi:acyl transferase domain-containing protein